MRTQGSIDQFSDPEEAVSALRGGKVEMVVGALPFLRSDPAALTVPRHIIRESGPLEPHSYYRMGPGSQLHAQVSGLDPRPEEHVERIRSAVATIQRTRLEKVVLARSVDIAFDPPVDPLLVAARLIDHSTHRDGFIADLSPAGGRFEGSMLVGASPEVLIRRQGTRVSAYPLAGSAPRHPDRDRDALVCHQLRTSAKDLGEHAFVVEHMRQALTPLCEDLRIPRHPELMKTSEMWHLATPIEGTLRDSRTTALELALAVHPTPAICGTPTEAAEEIIRTAETARGFYAGAVGWCDAQGDGQYMVAIRCAEVYRGGHAARAWAGGGIVADSDPQAEFEETSAKLRTIMTALGL